MAIAPKGGGPHDLQYSKHVCGTNYCRCHLVSDRALPRYASQQVNSAVNLGTKKPIGIQLPMGFVFLMNNILSLNYIITRIISFYNEIYISRLDIDIHLHYLNNH